MDTSFRNDDEQLRSVAAQNARSILRASRHAERELICAKEALEGKTKELAHSLAMMRATLESTADGIVVTDDDGVITDFNEKYLSLWSLERELLARRDHRKVVRVLSRKFNQPAQFLARIEEIYQSSPPETFDLLELADGRVFERSSHVQTIANRNFGRVWSFRDVTPRIRAERSVYQQARTLELLHKTGMALAAKLDVQTILQKVTDAATQITGAQFGAYFSNLDDQHGHSFTLNALAGAPHAAFADLPLPWIRTLFGPVFRGEQVARIDDVRTHPDYEKLLPFLGTQAEPLSIRSCMAVPVTLRSTTVYGGLVFGHEQAGAFTERDELVVRGIAAQAAIAIDNARLFTASEEARAQLQEFNVTLEQRVAERSAALTRSEQQFQQLVAGVNDCAIYMLDPQGYLVSWNAGAEHIKGYRAEEIIGQHFSVFFTPEDRARGAPQHALQTAERVGKYEAESWRVRKDGTHFWASALVDAIRDSSGKLVGFAKVTRDMTERRAMQEQLHQAQKMEAVGQLTGGVAHDFNNLLTVILGNLETLWRQIPAQDSRLRRAVDQATRGAQRAATLTQRLLAFSRRQPLNPKPINVNRLVGSIADLIRQTLRDDIVINTALGGGLYSVEVDPHQLESALLNLAVNSRDAMPRGGSFTIETASVDMDEHYAAQFAEMQPGQFAVITVTDTGVGMSEEVMGRAFDPFFTTKPIGSGTGLGLSQVYGFVKQSGGHIKLYSEVGRGTTVKIYLPRLQRVHIENDYQPPLVAPESVSNETILVVEDDCDVRIYSTEILKELGFTVLEAGDAVAALRLLDQHPEVQLLFTDIGLPGLNGCELAEQARQQRPDLKVLFTTAYARNAIVPKELDAAVLTKPFTRAQLAVRVQEVLEARQALQKLAS